MKVLKALSKQLFGAKYERIGKSLMACLILFFVIYMTEIRVAIAPRILYLTATVFSAGIMWQAIGSGKNADSFMGLFMLPFGNRRMTVSIMLAFTGYTLITQSFLVMVLFYAACEWSAVQIIVSLLCACNGCFIAAAWYTMTRKKKLLPIVLLWFGAIILPIIFVQETIVITVLALASMLLSILRLLLVDAYVFYRPVSAKVLIRHTGKNGSVLLYLLRYLLTNKNYLVNTAGLCAVAAFLPAMLGQFEGLSIMPLGFAILCLNTPICILLSCDPDLEQAIRVLPGQAKRFCTRYSLFIFSVNAAVNSVYLISWQIQHSGVGCIEIMTALLFALQSAALSVLLEWLRPLRNWKIENDLWRHPRKYLVPLAMMLIAALISIWPIGVWIWLCAILAECFSLLLIARRI